MSQLQPIEALHSKSSIAGRKRFAKIVHEYLDTKIRCTGDIDSLYFCDVIGSWVPASAKFSHLVPFSFYVKEMSQCDIQYLDHTLWGIKSVHFNAVNLWRSAT